MMDFNQFSPFNPLENDDVIIADRPGLYLILLRPGSSLPDIELAYERSLINYCGQPYEVIYVGISKDSLRKRDYNTHFEGNNAGKSTLRKSIGSLMGLRKTYRSAGEVGKSNPKTKFISKDEEILSDWMRNNLLLLFLPLPSSKLEIIETEMINNLNPPLNLSKNHNIANKSFRHRLSELRATNLSELSDKEL